MKPNPTYFKTQEEFRNWLLKNHDSQKDIWVAYYKKNSNKQGITYNEAVEEALCFGWIDGITKKIDETSYASRYTPRRPKSNWSETNIKKANELIKNKKMHESGLKAFKNRDLVLKLKKDK